MKPTINQSGTPLSPDGYVLCQKCGEPVRGISRETSPAYAFCPAKCDGSPRAQERERKRQEFFDMKKQED